MSKKDKDAGKIFAEIGNLRNLPEKVVQEALHEAMEKAYQKQTGIKEIKVKTDFSKGQLHIYHVRIVADENDEDFDDELNISLEDAREKNPAAQIGDEDLEEVDFTDFDRAAIVLAKSVMKQKIREAEKAEVYENFKDRVGDLMTGFIQRKEDKFLLVLLGGTPDGKPQTGSTTAMMKYADQIPTEQYNEDSLIQVVVKEVNKDSKGAIVLVSRAAPEFIRRLFEKEVPEIYNGIIEIKAIARDPGARAKIAVYSHNENIDPIGACIGPRGSRVQQIISELNGEKIDILEWSDDLQKLIANALAPAQEVVVIPNENVRGGMYAVVPDNQLSLAIGKKGQNARLAVKLTGHKIDIKSQSQMEELGIDYQALAKAMHDEYLEKKAAEQAYKQQQRIDEIKASAPEDADIEGIDFTYFDESDLDDSHERSSDTLAARELEEVKSPAVLEQKKPEAAEAPASETSEMEELARIAKEKRKSLAERRSQYAPKPSETIIPAAPAGKQAKTEPAEHKEEKKPFRKKPSFTAMQPIYTEDELKEIEENELEEELSASWNDDVDYEEYDEYYDDEY